MKYTIKKLFAAVVVFTLIFTISGCNLMGNTKKTYSSYVQSLLDANYKAEFTEYMAITGVSEEEARQVYEDGIEYLAEALMTAYGVNDVEGSDIKEQFKTLAEEIYSHASYEITDVAKVDGVYQVTVTIYPIDILVITYDDIVAYIENTNARVTAGDYNDYELEDYELEYAEGILQILTAALPDISNEEGVAVTVTILDNDEYYYISDADFLALDQSILATISVNDDGTTGSTDSGEDNSEEQQTDGNSEEPQSEDTTGEQQTGDNSGRIVAGR